MFRIVGRKKLERMTFQKVNGGNVNTGSDGLITRLQVHVHRGLIPFYSMLDLQPLK